MSFFSTLDYFAVFNNLSAMHTQPTVWLRLLNSYENNFFHVSTAFSAVSGKRALLKVRKKHKMPSISAYQLCSSKTDPSSCL